jgi:periplasmic protein TonB
VPRIFRIASVVVHMIVVGCAFVAQLMAIGPLPTPRAPITFVGSMPIAIVEPPPPPRAAAARTTSAPAASIDAAPIVAPQGVAPETFPERRDTLQSTVPGLVDGGLPGFGVAVERAAPPPRPAPPPQEPIRLHSGMQAPRKVTHVDPLYPAVARAARVEGVVILEAVIDARGRVDTVRVLRSIPLLDQAAVDAVKQWAFTPALLNGAAVPVVMTVTVNFQLSAR